jgi:hypothetical protein
MSAFVALDLSPAGSVGGTEPPPVIANRLRCVPARPPWADTLPLMRSDGFGGGAVATFSQTSLG